MAPCAMPRHRHYRHRRHVHASPDEWIVVHRDPPNEGCGCLILLVLIVLMLEGC